MASRKCSGCGWEYPAHWPEKTCRFCHSAVEGGQCAVCGKFVDKLNRSNYRCKDCNTKEHTNWKQNRRAMNEDAFTKWKENIAKIATPYKTLTEEQWMEACNHFKGCAYCGAQEIEARSMFIQFKYGGRYCNWNIIPACEQCETLQKATENPFKRMDRTLMRGKGYHARAYGFTNENLQKITEYLHSKMEVDNETKTY